MMIPDKSIAGILVMTVANLLQLSSFRKKIIRVPGKDSIKRLLGLQLWNLSKYAELSEVLRQNDKLFVDLLNKFQVGNIDDDVEKLLKAKFIHESYEKYSKNAFKCTQRINLL